LAYFRILGLIGCCVWSDHIFGYLIVTSGLDWILGLIHKLLL